MSLFNYFSICETYCTLSQSKRDNFILLKHTKKGALQKIIRNTPSSISPYVKIKLLVILNIGISGTVIMRVSCFKVVEAFKSNALIVSDIQHIKS